MKDGLIRVQGQDIVLLDVEGLRARADVQGQDIVLLDVEGLRTRAES